MTHPKHAFVPVGTVYDYEGTPVTPRRDYTALVFPAATIERDQFPLLRQIIDDAERDILACEAEMRGDVEDDGEAESVCRVCAEHITLLGGMWTVDDGTTCCYNTGIAPFVPHKPKEG